MSANPLSRSLVRCSISQGGPDVTEVTWRPAAESEAPTLHKMSTPFMATGVLLDRPVDFYLANLADFHVLEVAGEVVAGLGVRRTGDVAELYNVVVDEQWHGQGLGRVLVAGAVAMLHDLGVGYVVLFSRDGIAWFQQLGFVLCDASRLPAERLAEVDAERGSALLGRPTVRAIDPLDAVAKMTAPRVHFSDSQVRVDWEPGGRSLLELADRLDIDVDRLCQAGVCGTCRSRLLSGTVGYSFEPIADLEGEEMLLCIAQPVTDVVIDR